MNQCRKQESIVIVGWLSARQRRKIRSEASKKAEKGTCARIENKGWSSFIGDGDQKVSNVAKHQSCSMDILAGDLPGRKSSIQGLAVEVDLFRQGASCKGRSIKQALGGVG